MEVCVFHRPFDWHATAAAIDSKDSPFSVATSLESSMDPENITLANALDATSALICRQLPQHIMVGPMPLGAVTPVALPLRDLNGSGQQLKHFFDVIYVYDHDGAINFDALAPILRDKAWRELPAPFGLKTT